MMYRRELLRIGGLSILAAPLASPIDGAPAPQPTPRRSCIFMMLQGGASHHDLWDPKPSASREIRGPFETIRVKGDSSVRFGSLLEQTAKIFPHLSVIRSMTHKFTNHIAGTYITLTGSTNQPDRDREAHSDDFPGPGAILNYLEKIAPSVPRSISLPNWLSIPGPSNRMPGQFAGFLGGVHDPFLVAGDPNQPKFNPLSLKMTEGMTVPRIGSRLSLLDQLDAAAFALEQDLDKRYDRLRHSAYDLVADGRVRKALDLSNESDAIRDAYGRNSLGQSLLLARRLVEAGVQFVAYNEFNQKWDTHGGLANRYKQIVPPMEQGFAALVSDLDQRGMLPSTLVVNTGEFGRTPVINKGAGRDHWPNVYSSVVAGGGIRGGQVIGASDSKGAEVTSRPVAPTDLWATLWTQLGVNPRTIVYDRLDRPHQVSSGSAVSELVDS